MTETGNQNLTCAGCRALLPQQTFNTATLSMCPGCSLPLYVTIFPALQRKSHAGSGDSLLTDTDSSCFYHPDKTASIVCEGCGRFLCSLCDIDFRDSHFCAPCIESGRKKGRLKNLEQSSVLYDDIALSLAVIPVVIPVFIWFTIVTAPIVLFMVVWYWRRPIGVLPRTKLRFVVAAFLAAVEIAGWALIYSRLFT